MKATTAAIALACLSTPLLTGCEQSSGTAPLASAAPDWVLTSDPGDALSITDAKANASEGDTITIRGIIGGTAAPITAGSPVFRVIDTGLYNKCTSEDDHCATPWDYCCADPDDIVENSATVQLVATDGTPFAGDPTAQLSPMDEIVIVGNVGPRPNAEVLTIRATGVYRIE